MLRSILLFSLLFLSQQTNAASSSSEDYSHLEYTDSEYISSSDDEPDEQDLLEYQPNLLVYQPTLDVISVKLWGLYAAQKQKFKMVSSEARMKTAWLITMRIIVPCVVDLAMTQTHERHTDLKSDFPIIFNCLVRSLRDKQFANCSIALQDFDIDYDDKCYIALEVASKVALKLFAHKGDMVEERLRPTAALIKSYNFFLSDINNIVQSIFSTIFENLPAQIQYHPFREYNTLSQFYERYFS